MRSKQRPILGLRQSYDDLAEHEEQLRELRRRRRLAKHCQFPFLIGQQNFTFGHEEIERLLMMNTHHIFSA